MTHKRLALFLDGTWNTVESETNISRLHDLVADEGGGVSQLRYYDSGVGTGRFEWLRGGALGYGLGRNVIEAYEWLAERYDDGDEIYIFGFSRGAYTARSLAGLIVKCGLLRRPATLDAGTLFARYRKLKNLRPIYELDYEAARGGKLTAEEEELRRASRRVPIRLVGVWDTVGSLGIPFGNIPGLSRRQFQFHHTRLSNLFDYAYHALAIDEHRAAFRPSLWTRFIPKKPDPATAEPARFPKVEQRWFVGAHADVGGGNPTRLPHVAAHWLAEKASDAGLAFDRISPPGPKDHLDPVTDSYRSFMGGLYRLIKLGQRFYRTIGAGRVEKRHGWVEPVGETIDASVFARFGPDYCPPALLAWAKRHDVDLESAAGSHDAATGKPLMPQGVSPDI